MTTIAYRAGILAADTGMCVGDSRIGECSKIRKGPHGLAGAAGNAHFCAAFVDWVAEGEIGDAPTPKLDKDASMYDRGIIVRGGDVIEVHEPGGKFVIGARYYALGSGRPEALGAMYAGASARKAVKAAMEHDTHTWGSVETVSFDK